MRILVGSKLTRTFAGALTLAAIGGSGLIAIHSTRVQAATPAGGIAVGKAAPAFTLPNVTTGASMSLEALRNGKSATVVMFIATRCPVSNAYNDRMETLAKRYQSMFVKKKKKNTNWAGRAGGGAGRAGGRGGAGPGRRGAGGAGAGRD